MRWPLWRHADSDLDTLDPELLSLFAKSTHLPEVGVSDLARGRARVAAQLAPQTMPPVAGGWLKRRFAWSAAGGGSMWAALLGTAFASKATTAGVGLAVLLAGVGTAEVTGIGPQVRESLGITQPANHDDDENVDALVLEDNDADVNASENGDSQRADVASSEDAPGNLVTNIRPDGTFSARGILRAEGVETSSGAILPLGDAEVTVPGRPTDEDPDLADYEGFLVLVTGTCIVPDGEELDVATDCTLESVQVLGQAGQGKPEDAGQPEVLPSNAPEDAGKPENPGQSDLQPADNGSRPDDAGKPADTPGGPQH